MHFPAPLARRLATMLLMAALGPAWAQLNDTGQMLCYDGSAMVACTPANTGDAAGHPGQDARFGRDAAQAQGELPAKIGGGAAGFDFTALNASGAPNNGDGTPGGHACVRDNVTNLWWEIKQADATSQLRHQSHRYTWYDSNIFASQVSNTCNGTLPGNGCNTQAYVAAVNAAGLCGKTDWRLPTERELLSIVHYGASSPAVDTAYFPNTPTNYGWWTSHAFAPVATLAWFVNFTNGGASSGAVKAYPLYVRLVRSGP